MRLSTYLIGLPVAILAGVLAIANRQAVTFSLDPFSLTHPDGNLSVELPLFVLLLITLALGLMLGWGIGMLSARRRRKRAEQRQALPPQGPQSTHGP